MSMPGADGKMMEMPFHGIGTEGYDNVRKKFMASWIDNMGTGILLMEGTYDALRKAKPSPTPGEGRNRCRGPGKSPTGVKCCQIHRQGSSLSRILSEVHDGSGSQSNGNRLHPPIAS